MKVAFSEILTRTGIGHLIGMRYRGSGLIFMMHSIVDDTQTYLNQTIRCSTDTLERGLWWAKERNLDIVSLDEAVKRLHDPHAKPFIVFTFDDGYRDNITKALPIMERHNAPMTIYVTTHMITRQLYGWWLGLVSLIRNNDLLDIEPMEERFVTNKLNEKAAVLQKIGNWVHSDGARAELLRPVFEQYGVDVEKLLDEEAMTQTDLQHAASHPLVSIGGHTTSHCFLNLQKADIAYKEIADNKAYLEQIIDQSVDHFAYPYGAAGPREAEIVNDIGFRTAVTTNNGTIFPQHTADNGLMALPRETLDEHDTTGCLDCRNQGVYRCIKSRAASPVAAF